MNRTLGRQHPTIRRLRALRRDPRLRREESLSEEEIIVYLVHSRVTEQRASEEVAEQWEIFGEDSELGRAIRMIAVDEVNHLAYTHEELLRFCAAGHDRFVRSLLLKDVSAQRTGMFHALEAE